MAEYLFEVRELSSMTSYPGSAMSDDEAKLEAVKFLGEIMREMSTLYDGDLSVAVLKDGHAICTVSAVILAQI